jgi:hypothetical protein
MQIISPCSLIEGFPKTSFLFPYQWRLDFVGSDVGWTSDQLRENNRKNRQFMTAVLQIVNEITKKRDSNCLIRRGRAKLARFGSELVGGAMIYRIFGIRGGLVAAGRLHPVARVQERISVYEMLLLLCCGGVSATVIGFVRLGLRLPGHSIVLSLLPMALGLALAPRRFGGFLMSAGAFATASIYSGAGLAQYGSGAFVSLCLMGPMMDLALTKVRSGWRLYLGLILAGIGTNLMALASRSTSKLLGLDPGTRLFGEWLPQAILTYSICGAVAGLLGALCFFHLRNQRSKAESADPGRTLS